VARKTKNNEIEDLGLLGVGLDNQDGHHRVTRGEITPGEEFLLVGGSEETHERMQDVAIHVTESVQNKGKRLQDISGQEIADLIRRVLDK
jgi:hypothetical protein